MVKIGNNEVKWSKKESIFTKLRLDEKSIIFARGDDLNEKTIKRLGRSKYDKDKASNNLCEEFKKEASHVKKSKKCSRY